MALSNKTLKAIEKYGKETCMKAYRLNSDDGEGASTIGFAYQLTTNQADAAINAGEEIAREERDQRQRNMFGCPVSELEATAMQMSPLTIAMSFLSDAQEEMSAGHTETARKTINRAKWLIDKAQHFHNPVSVAAAQEGEPGI